MGIVRALIKKVNDNKNFIDELVAKRDSKIARRETIKAHIQKAIDNDEFISTREDMRLSVEQELHITAKNKEIGDIMKNDLKMKFKKVKPQAIHTNSEKNRVL